MIAEVEPTSPAPWRASSRRDDLIASIGRFPVTGVEADSRNCEQVDTGKPRDSASHGSSRPAREADRGRQPSSSSRG